MVHPGFLRLKGKTYPPEYLADICKSISLFEAELNLPGVRIQICFNKQSFFSSAKDACFLSYPCPHSQCDLCRLTRWLRGYSATGLLVSFLVSSVTEKRKDFERRSRDLKSKVNNGDRRRRTTKQKIRRWRSQKTVSKVGSKNRRASETNF